MSSRLCFRISILWGCFLLESALVSAQALQPATVMKAFSPSSTTPNTAVTLTITLSNPNNSALINAFVRDVPPAGVTAVFGNR
ncbi:MAG: DUF11 domain-containing protein [Acidobacteriaceae bacterium]|nr:DUF11 domain-containing protein [Acidobacteriaceae bacterium]